MVKLNSLGQLRQLLDLLRVLLLMQQSPQKANHGPFLMYQTRECHLPQQVTQSLSVDRLLIWTLVEAVLPSLLPVVNTRPSHVYHKVNADSKKATLMIIVDYPGRLPNFKVPHTTTIRFSTSKLAILETMMLDLLEVDNPIVVRQNSASAISWLKENVVMK
jgi:hypothetical protein